MQLALRPRTNRTPFSDSLFVPQNRIFLARAFGNVKRWRNAERCADASDQNEEAGSFSAFRRTRTALQR